MRSVGILVAMWEELKPLRRHWRLDWTGPGNFFTGRWGQWRLQIALSGVGRGNAARAVQDLLRQGRPDVLVSLGYSGGLRPDLHPGDALQASEIETSEKKIYYSQSDGCRLLCVEKLAATRGSKHELARHHPLAWAVDMESAVLAQAAQQASLPWRALRVIIDPLDRDLPVDFSRCVSREGQTAPLKLARQVLTSPLKIPALLEFAGWEKRARVQLLEKSQQLLETLTL